MLDYDDIQRIWNEREEHIFIGGMFFNEKETKYLINVLKECNFDNFCNIIWSSLLDEVKEAYRKGIHYKTIAKELRDTNEFLETIM